MFNILRRLQAHELILLCFLFSNRFISVAHDWYSWFVLIIFRTSKQVPWEWSCAFFEHSLKPQSAKGSLLTYSFSIHSRFSEFSNGNWFENSNFCSNSHTVERTVVCRSIRKCTHLFRGLVVFDFHSKVSWLCANEGTAVFYFFHLFNKNKNVAYKYRIDLV